MKSPYEARQEREAAATPRIQLLLDEADRKVVDPRYTEPYFIYPGNVASLAGIEPFTHQELLFAVQRMQAAGWVATFSPDQRDGDSISLRSPASHPMDAPDDTRRFRVPRRG